MSKSFLFNFRRIHNLLNDDSVVSLITLGVGITGILGHFCYTFGTTELKNIEIQHKYKYDRNGFTEFMVIDENGKHYNINNSFWYWKWDSIEDWNKIKPKQIIPIKYYGFRIPMFGFFPNIVNINAHQKYDFMNIRIIY